MICEIFISTVKREPNYIHQTLASMYMGGFPPNGHLNFVMDDNQDILRAYDFPGITRYVRAKELAEGLTGRQRGLYNYQRCLNLAKGKNAIVLEDDVHFCHDWARKLHAAIDEIERDFSEDYVLSLSRTQLSNPERQIIKEGVNYSLIDPAIHMEGNTMLCFCGLYGFYYPKRLGVKLDQMQAYLQQNVEKAPPSQYDMVLNCFWKFAGFKVCVVKPGIIHHIGKLSGSESGFLHNIRESP